MNYENGIVIHRKAVKSIEKLSKKEKTKIKPIITLLKSLSVNTTEYCKAERV